MPCNSIKLKRTRPAAVPHTFTRALAHRVWTMFHAMTLTKSVWPSPCNTFRLAPGKTRINMRFIRYRCDKIIFKTLKYSRAGEKQGCITTAVQKVQSRCVQCWACPLLRCEWVSFRVQRCMIHPTSARAQSLLGQCVTSPTGPFATANKILW